MLKNRFLLLFSLLFASSVVITSCSKDDDEDNPPTPSEFVADDNTFVSFMNWSKDATAQGADPALGGMAHGGNDETVVREVYFKDGQAAVNGSYPVGTIIVKHSKNPEGTVDERTALVKRGNNFNSEGGDWEWFMLAPDGKIARDENGNAMRGANLMNGMCLQCHTVAKAKDYVFSK